MQTSSISLVKEVLGGSIRAVARLISMVEDEHPEAESALTAIYPYTGKAVTIGISGPLGAGKSTLVDKIATEYSRNKKKVGVVAVDPSSPFTGGAFLGDRFRMGRASSDPNIFIRSLGARGETGGLSKCVGNVIKILDAFGKDIIIVETLGVGQDEVDVMNVADTTVVVMAPGLGDFIQTLKAGMMEIGDIYIVNKAESPEADNLYNNIHNAIHMGNHKSGWVPPVLKTVGTRGEGVDDVIQTVEKHLQHLKENGYYSKRQAERVRLELAKMIRDKLMRKINELIVSNETFDKVVQEAVEKKKEPYSHVNRVIESVINKSIE